MTRPIVYIEGYLLGPGWTRKATLRERLLHFFGRLHEASE